MRHELLQTVEIEVRKDRREVVCADVDDDAHPRRFLMLGHFLQKWLDERDRQIVRAVEAEILERALHVALSGAGKARDHDEEFGSLHLLDGDHRDSILHEVRDQNTVPL